MKILFAASKEMDVTNLEERTNDFNFKEIEKNINYIKSVGRNNCKKVFDTSEDIYEQNQQINIYSKKAIELYNGISFRQLENYHNEKYSNLMILSALYGFSYAFDYISPYRYDYTMSNSKLYRNQIYEQLNNLLKNEDVVYNLASKEFSQGIQHPNLVNFNFLIKDTNSFVQQSVVSKKMRGQMVNYLINNDNPDLEKFNYDGFEFIEKCSTKNLYIYVKQFNKNVE